MAWEESDDDVRAAAAAVERSENKFRYWREEYRTYEGFYDNYQQTYNANSATGYDGPGRNASTIVTRNAVAANVYAEIRRLCPTFIRFEASPELSAIEREVDGTPVLVDSEHASYAQAECVTYGFRATRFLEQFVPVMENARIANEAWMKLVTWDGGAAPETQVLVEGGIDLEDGSEIGETSSKKVKPRKPANSLAGGRFPAWIWVSVDDVIVDADAIMPNEVNAVTHRVVQPKKNMVSQEIDDFRLVIGPEGKLVREPVIDPATGEVARVKKFKNMDKVNGNYKFYLDKQGAGIRKRGDMRNAVDPGNMTEGDIGDYIVHYERNYRIPADSALVVKEFGGVPKTIDGFVYRILDYVEDTSGGSGDGPTLIRAAWYPVDLGGFALKKIHGRVKAGSQKGYSSIRNYWEAMQLSNYLMSFKMSWLSTIKPVNIIDKALVDPDVWKKAQDSDVNSAIFVDRKTQEQLANAIFTTSSPLPPQDIDILNSQLNAIQDEAVGWSQNQRLQTTGDQSATQSQIIDKNADIQAAFDVEIVKQYIEDCAKMWIRLFRATLGPRGRMEVPGSDGAFVTFDVLQLELESVFKMDYAGFQQVPNPVQTKQLEQLTQQIMQTPPQLWPAMRPFWAVQSAQFTPAVMAAFRKFEKEAFGKKPDTDPDREHNVIREGIFIMPDPEENFVDTIPKHEKMYNEFSQNPKFSGWLKPSGPNGEKPIVLLAAHINASKKMAMARGMGPALGLVGDQAGAQRKERGSGPGSGRLSQDMAPSEGSIESGAASAPSPMEA